MIIKKAKMFNLSSELGYVCRAGCCIPVCIKNVAWGPRDQAGTRRYPTHHHTASASLLCLCELHHLRAHFSLWKQAYLNNNLSSSRLTD